MNKVSVGGLPPQSSDSIQAWKYSIQQRESFSKPFLQHSLTEVFIYFMVALVWEQNRLVLPARLLACVVEGRDWPWIWGTCPWVGGLAQRGREGGVMA